MTQTTPRTEQRVERGFLQRGECPRARVLVRGALRTRGLVQILEMRGELIDDVERKPRRAAGFSVAPDDLGPVHRSHDRSRVWHAGDLAERGDEAGPIFALRGQHPASGIGDAVMTAAALTGFFDPAPANPPAILEPVERRVQRGEREPERPARSFVDLPPDLVAVQAALLDERENQDLGAAFLGLVDRSTLEHEGRLYDGQLN